MAVIVIGRIVGPVAVLLEPVRMPVIAIISRWS